MPLREDKNVPYTEAVELYHNAFSLCSAKVRICLAEKGIAFKSHHIHLIESGWYQNCSPEFKQINPEATVPVLVHNGHPVYESHDQIEYIDRILSPHTKSLTPAHAIAKEEVERWVDFTSVVCPLHFGEGDVSARMGCCAPGLSLVLFAAMIRDVPYTQILWGVRHHPIRMRPVMFTLLKLFGPWLIVVSPKLRVMCTVAREQIRRHLRTMEALLHDGRRFLTGDAFTLADVGMMPILERLDAGGFHGLYTDLPHVVAYWARLRERPAYRAAIADVELPIVRRARAQVEAWKRERPYWASCVFSLVAR